MIEKATILIADISGYTEFVAATEIMHSSHILSELLEVIAKETTSEFTLTEVEGDALLLCRKGDAIEIEDLVKICENTFIAFHTYLRIIKRDTVCQCGACTGAERLCIKFVAHFGDIQEIKIGKFSKPSGLAMVVVHRLLKNTVTFPTYILLTNVLAEAGKLQSGNGDWVAGKADYKGIPTVEHQSISLLPLVPRVPEAPPLTRVTYGPQTETLELEVKAPFSTVFNAIADPAQKLKWVDVLNDVTLEVNIERLGTKHECILNDDMGTIEFENMPANNSENLKEIISVATVAENGLQFYDYYSFIQENEKVKIKTFIASMTDKPLPEEFVSFVMGSRNEDFGRLKKYCEK